MQSITSKVLLLTATAVACLLMTGRFLSPAEARCRWVWKGANSYYVCDEDDVRAHRRPTICDFKSEQGRDGLPRTRTVFCRPDGSRWKEVIVSPHGVVVKVFRHDGSLASKKRFATGEVAPYPSPPPVPHGPRWRARNFDLNLMGVEVKGTVERLGHRLRGVAHVYRVLGGKDTYHFTGRIKGNQIVASHTSGHHFRGHMTRGGELDGVLITKGGLRLPIKVPFQLP